MIEKLTEFLTQLKAIIQAATIRIENEKILQEKLDELEGEKIAALELINKMNKELQKF